MASFRRTVRKSMEFVKAVLTNWFFWGFVLGFIFCVLSMQAHWKTKRELKKIRGHLSEKLEIEADNFATLKQEKEKLKEENENLRVKVKTIQVGNGNPAALERELEIYARAEKALAIGAPGFSAAWEKAKADALSELEAEEAGKKPFQKVRKIISAMVSSDKASTRVEALPHDSSNARSASSSVD